MQCYCATLILPLTLLRGYRCATSWCDLDLTFDLISDHEVELLSGPFLGFRKV